MISVIIPTLNEESVIADVLKKLQQGFTIPHEIIVSDGKSKDRTAEIARQYADRVIVHDKPERQNIAQGRNAGAAAAVGDYLAFMDADCYIPEPDKFFAQALAIFARDPRIVAVTPKIRVLPEMETAADRFFFGLLNFSKWLQNNRLHRGESGGEMQIMPRAVFEKLHGFREDLITREDADMFLRLSKVGRTYYDHTLVVYHTGRRAHKIGWTKLLWDWTLNVVWVILFDKAHAKEWKVVR